MPNFENKTSEQSAFEQLGGGALLNAHPSSKCLEAALGLLAEKGWRVFEINPISTKNLGHLLGSPAERLAIALVAEYPKIIISHDADVINISGFHSILEEQRPTWFHLIVPTDSSKNLSLMEHSHARKNNLSLLSLLATGIDSCEQDTGTRVWFCRDASTEGAQRVGQQELHMKHQSELLQFAATLLKIIHQCGNLSTQASKT